MARAEDMWRKTERRSEWQRWRQMGMGLWNCTEELWLFLRVRSSSHWRVLSWATAQSASTFHSVPWLLCWDPTKSMGGTSEPTWECLTMTAWTKMAATRRVSEKSEDAGCILKVERTWPLGGLNVSHETKKGVQSDWSFGPSSWKDKVVVNWWGRMC